MVGLWHGVSHIDRFLPDQPRHASHRRYAAPVEPRDMRFLVWTDHRTWQGDNKQQELGIQQLIHPKKKDDIIRYI